MTYRPGEDLGDGWTRVHGEGPSRWGGREAWRPPVIVPVLVPASDHEDGPDIDTETEAPWPDVAEQPIVPFLRDVVGFTPWPRQAEILNGIYGLDVRLAVLRLGRRSGKGRIAAGIAVYEATANADAHMSQVLPGEQVAVAVVAPSQKQARVVHRYIRGFLSARGLAGMVVRDTEDEIELSNGMVIMTMPCTARSTRGIAVAVLVMDEAAWMLDGDGSPLAAKEVHDALAPATAQFAEGRVLVLSTPRWSTGWFADLCRQAASGAHASMRHWHATTTEMNPSASMAEFVATERAKDPAMAAREYDARFASGVGTVFADGLVRSAATDLPETGSTGGRSYVISLDASSGTGKDAYALVAGSRQGETVEVREVRSWRGAPASPVNHAALFDEVAALSRELAGAPVLLDQYASEVTAQQLEARGCRVLRRAWSNESKEVAVTVTRQLLTAQRLRIPRHAALIAELVQYEGRRLASGRIRYSAPPGAHDDHCTAILGLCHHIAGVRKGWSGITADRAGGVV